MSHRAAASLDDIEIPYRDERRTTVRRTDDRTLIQKCRALASAAGQLIAVAVALIAVIAWLAALLGVRLQGPPQTMAAIAQHTDSLDRRVSRLEAGAQQTTTQLGTLTTNVQFLSYLLCVKDAGRDPVATGRCGDIIRMQRGTP